MHIIGLLIPAADHSFQEVGRRVRRDVVIRLKGGAEERCAAVLCSMHVIPNCMSRAHPSGGIRRGEL